MRQLEFDLSADVIAFPPSRRRAYVRQVARTIMENTEEDAERYWQAVVDGIGWRMLHIGISRTEVEAAIFSFREAVQREIWLVEGREGGAG